jgi:hypothetical protein
LNKALTFIAMLFATVSCAAMIIESESARKEREAHVALIRDKFDFQVVASAVGNPSHK